VCVCLHAYYWAQVERGLLGHSGCAAAGCGRWMDTIIVIDIIIMIW